MAYFNPINPHRHQQLMAQTGGHRGQADILDRLVYRVQNSQCTLANGARCFTAPMSELASFLGCKSSRSTRYHLAQLEAKGLIERHTKNLSQGGTACWIALTEKTAQALDTVEALSSPSVPANDMTSHNPSSGKIHQYQAINHHRYQALQPLVGDALARATHAEIHVLNALIWFIQSDARRKERGPEDLWVALTRQKLCDKLGGMSTAQLQRHLSSLQTKGLIMTERHRLHAFRVITHYQISSPVWQALRQGNLDMEIARQQATKKTQESVEKTVHLSIKMGGNQPKTSNYQPPARFEPSRPARFEPSNIVLNKLSLNKKHSTVLLRQEGQKLDKLEVVGTPSPIPDDQSLEISAQSADLPEEDAESVPPPDNADRSPVVSIAQRRGWVLDTEMSPTTVLNRRQQRYLTGTLNNLIQQHGCQFSDPQGLEAEFLFALRAIHHVLVGKRGFKARLNALAKILRERRWTTPHGFETYDEVGRGQKAKREAREAKWAAEKASQGVAPRTSQPIAPTSTAVGGVLSRMNVSRETPPKAVSEPPDEVQAHLDEMKRLVARAEDPQCSETARQGITDLLYQHQAAIQTLMGQSPGMADEERQTG